MKTKARPESAVREFNQAVSLTIKSSHTMMTKSTILDVTEENSPRELHRIIPFARLIEILRDKKNVLVYPTVWNDPYEAVELRTTLAYPLFKDSTDGSIKVGMPVIGEPIRAGIIEYGSPADFGYYCQSWSAATESETMWRAYSPDSDAVRVTVCVDKLLEQTVQALPDYSIYLGKVSYFSDEEIKWFAAQGDDNRKLQSRLVLEGSPWGISWARSLMKKRDAFRHEEEHRLVAIRGQSLMSTPKSKDLLLFHNIDPSTLIKKVLLDPRCTHNYIEQEEEIRRAGFVGAVSKSSILEPPNIQIWKSPLPRNWKP